MKKSTDSKKQGKKPLLVACDIYRPAAIDQLKDIGKQLNIEVYEEGKGDPVEISRRGIEYAKTKGIRTMMENHGYFCQDSDRVERIVTGVADSNFGLLLDMGNFLCADENPVVAFGKLMPYVSFVHAKDFHVKSGNNIAPVDGFFTTRGGNYLRGAVLGHGDVPVFQCLSLAKNAADKNNGKKEE